MPQTSQILTSNEAESVIQARVDALLLTNERVLLAIDGNCCAGKTTLSQRLGSLLDANVFHLDDYFLQPQMRTPERLRQPGGNVDAERFLEEVLLPAKRGETAQVRKYDCHEDMLLAPVLVSPSRIAIVEGAYSLHPLLAPYYDLKVFCRVDPALQLERSQKRNGFAQLTVFQNRWIPLENAYFEAFQIEQSCDLIVDAIQK